MVSMSCEAGPRTYYQAYVICNIGFWKNQRLYAIMINYKNVFLIGKTINVEVKQNYKLVSTE